MSDKKSEARDLLTDARVPREGHPIDVACEVVDICDALIAEVEKLRSVITIAATLSVNKNIDEVKTYLDKAIKEFV